MRLLLCLSEVEEREVVFGGAHEKRLVVVHELRLERVLSEVVSDREVDQRGRQQDSDPQV